MYITTDYHKIVISIEQGQKNTARDKIADKDGISRHTSYQCDNPK